MTVLVHLCRGCGHQQGWHDARNRGYLLCRCCRDGVGDPDAEPTELATLSWPSGIPEGLWPPGSERNAGTMHAARTCACAACHEAAEPITRREHPVGAGRMEGLSGR